MLEPPTTCLTCETENQMMILKSLTPGGGVPAKGTPTVKSVNMVLEDPRGDAKYSPNDYGAKEDVTVTGRLWRGGGCRQGLLGTTAV